MRTKTRLTITIDSELLPRAREYARSQGVSLSSLADQILRDFVEAEEARRSREEA